MLDLINAVAAKNDEHILLNLNKMTETLVSMKATLSRMHGKFLA